MTIERLFAMYANLPEDDAVRSILREAKRDELFQAVRSAFVFWKRQQVREAEHSVAPAVQGSIRKNVRGMTPMLVGAEAPHLRLFKHSFYAGEERGYVLYEESTVEDHEARIAYLEKKRKGISETIRLHTNIIRMMQAARADTLGEIDQERWAWIARQIEENDPDAA